MNHSTLSVCLPGGFNLAVNEITRQQLLGRRKKQSSNSAAQASAECQQREVSGYQQHPYSSEHKLPNQITAASNTHTSKVTKYTSVSGQSNTVSKILLET